MSDPRDPSVDPGDPVLRVHLDSLGCRLNQAEIERIAAELTAAGHRLVPTVEECDWAVLNTCTVTHRAARDSRQRLGRIHRLNPLAHIAITGCWSTLEAQQAAAYPGVVHLVPNEDKEHLASLIAGVAPVASDRVRSAIPGSRRRARAFIAAQDGCDQACTYCLTTVARGASRSVGLDGVLADARAAQAGGVGELVLCGVQLSDWGRDLPGRPHLGVLVGAVLEAVDTPRIRLSSLEPWGLPDGLFERWDDPRLCRWLHLPLQSGCDATLARMGRPYRRRQALEVVQRARAAIPTLALRTDVMVGFPGETKSEFATSLAWFEALELADAHVFTYSPRPGTRAETMAEPVPHALAKERRLRVLEVTERSRRRFRQALVGSRQDVLWVRSEPSPDGWLLRGLTDQGVPVRGVADRDLWAQRSAVVVGQAGVEIVP